MSEDGWQAKSQSLLSLLALWSTGWHLSCACGWDVFSGRGVAAFTFHLTGTIIFSALLGLRNPTIFVPLYLIRNGVQNGVGSLDQSMTADTTRSKQCFQPRKQTTGFVNHGLANSLLAGQTTGWAAATSTTIRIERQAPNQTPFPLPGRQAARQASFSHTFCINILVTLMQANVQRWGYIYIYIYVAV